MDVKGCGGGVKGCEGDVKGMWRDVEGYEGMETWL